MVCFSRLDGANQIAVVLPISLRRFVADTRGLVRFGFPAADEALSHEKTPQG